MGKKKDELVEIPISLGITEPHCLRSQVDCMPTIHRIVMIKITARVKRGNRKRYDRMRAAENCGRLGAIVQVARLDSQDSSFRMLCWIGVIWGLAIALGCA